MQEEYIDGIWFETPERVNKFLRGLIYSDKGQLILRSTDIAYMGKKYRIQMNFIQGIYLHTPSNLSSKGVPYIRVDFINQNGYPGIAFFMKKAITIFGVIKETEKLFHKLQQQYYWVIQKNRSSFPQPQLFSCPKCHAQIVYRQNPCPGCGETIQWKNSYVDNSNQLPPVPSR
ncbi:MAG: hypothetical protein JSW11_14605 [Candidatus Heimdallarchaeota archaeon]|nr:MAG: hypothetical protein JSW11_14605 [Candidatus Heimdallarchaeota archaeon]